MMPVLMVGFLFRTVGVWAASSLFSRASWVAWNFFRISRRTSVSGLSIAVVGSTSAMVGMGLAVFAGLLGFARA